MKYKILQRPIDIDISMDDYNSIDQVSNGKYFKIGLIGTALLCINPMAGIYANDVSYRIKEDLTCDTVELLKEQSYFLDYYREKVSNIDKINFSYADLLSQILSFKTLENNWDGYGAIPLEVKSASNAIFTLDRIDKRLVGKISDFYPNTHGTISLEWENNLNEKLFLEIGNEFFSYYVKYNSSEPMFFNDLDFSNENIKALSSHIQAI